jgi:hypothetical protein
VQKAVSSSMLPRFSIAANPVDCSKARAHPASAWELLYAIYAKPTHDMFLRQQDWHLCTLAAVKNDRSVV